MSWGGVLLVPVFQRWFFLVSAATEASDLWTDRHGERAMFNPNTFTIAPKSVWASLMECAACVDGKHPLDGWKRRRATERTDVAYHEASKATVVLSRSASDLDEEYCVTTYWGADPKQVFESVRGERGFLELDGDWSWSGGTENMTEYDLYRYVATGAPADFVRPSLRRRYR